jgi:lipase
MKLHVHEWGDPDAPPLVCLHGVTAHGRRFRKLAEERLASCFHVLAPDLRGHGRSAWEPPWNFAQLLDDVVETVGVRGTWLGHSLGGRLVLDLIARSRGLVDRAVLLDPAIQLLPNVALDLAEQQRQDTSYASVEEAIEARRLISALTPVGFLEEEMEEHLRRSPDGRLRFRYCRAAAVTVYGELSTPPPSPETLRVPTLVVHAREFGLVRDNQLEALRAAPGPVEAVAVPGGHVVYWDAYEETADAIDAFLGSR